MTKNKERVAKADEFLESTPLFDEADIDQKTRTEQLDTHNPAYYLEDEVRMIIQALSFDKDDDPENRDGKKFEIDFAEKWYGWLNKRITKF
jgi:hypothetical protein